MTALTRGPLPARVYWRRRVLVVLLVLALTVAVARLLELGSDGSSQTPRASQVAAEPSTSPTTTTQPRASEPVAEPRITQPPDESRDRQHGKRDDRPVLADPEGVCADRDVAVTPSVRNPVGGGPVTFTLELRTITTPACTWQVSPSTLTMKITSGDDDIWSSQQCPRAIPSEEVVVRDNVSTEVEVTWSGRRSDEECSGATDWAMPGWYWVDVAALAGEPSDLHFELTAPEPDVETRTTQPDPKQQRLDRDGRKADPKQEHQDRDGRGRDGRDRD